MNLTNSTFNVIEYARSDLCCLLLKFVAGVNFCRFCEFWPIIAKTSPRLDRKSSKMGGRHKDNIRLADTVRGGGGGGDKSTRRSYPLFADIIRE